MLRSASPTANRIEMRLTANYPLQSTAFLVSRLMHRIYRTYEKTLLMADLLESLLRRGRGKPETDTLTRDRYSYSGGACCINLDISIIMRYSICQGPFFFY